MAKPTKKKRSESEDAGERVVVSEVMLRNAALAYAAVANLDPSDLRWGRCWRALRLAAIGMVAAIREAEGPPNGHSPPRALASRRSATPAQAPKPAPSVAIKAGHGRFERRGS
jgi:hypothetical protein